MIFEANYRARIIPTRTSALLLCIAAAHGEAHPASAQTDTIPPGRSVTIPQGGILRVSEDGIVTVARNRPEPRAPRANGNRWGAVGSTTNEQEIRRAARDLDRHGESSEREAADRLRALLRQPGSALYLEMNRERPFRITLQPTRGDRFYTETTRGGAREIVGSLSARTGRDGEQVYAFYVDGTTLPEYVIEVPPAVTHVTLVVNGETVAAERPVNPAGGAVTLDIE